MTHAVPLAAAVLAAAQVSGEFDVRARRVSDRAFLSALYASTRKRELEAAQSWSDADKAQFLAMQFEAQDRHYCEHFSDAEFALIERNETAIGRLYLQPRDDEIRLIDIALVENQRGAGLGTAILEGLLAVAAGNGKAVRLHVEHFNRAIHLYRRLGFTPVEDRGVYCFMAWDPPNP